MQRPAPWAANEVLIREGELVMEDAPGIFLLEAGMPQVAHWSGQFDLGHPDDHLD